MVHYYYWLIPDPPHRSALQQTIDKFAQVYGGPRFEPHITLGSGTNIPSPPPPLLPAPSISLNSVQSEENYFRNLYYTCAETEALTSLRTYFSNEDHFVPHLSLVYGQHSAARRRDWCSHLPLYTKTILCSEIWIVTGGANINAWAPLIKYPLNRPS